MDAERVNGLPHCCRRAASAISPDWDHILNPNIHPIEDARDVPDHLPEEHRGVLAVDFPDEHDLPANWQEDGEWIEPGAAKRTLGLDDR